MNSHALIEKGEFTEPLLESVVIEVDPRKDCRIREKADGRTCCLGRSQCMNWSSRFTLLVFLLPNLALAANFGFKPFRKRVDNCDAYAVQPARDLVRVVV